MQKELSLEIISPEGLIFKGDAYEVVAPAARGQVAILPGHTPLFTKLSEGEVLVKKQTGDLSVALTGGFLEVLDNRVQILADYAIRSEEIEARSALEAKKKAEEILRTKKTGVDLSAAKAELKRSLLKLAVSERKRKRPL